MLTINDFNKLPKNEQVYALFHDGKEILHRKSGDYIVKLFIVHDLYVEIWYNSGKNVIDRIQVINETDLVRIYAKEINLSGLIKK